MFDDRRSSPPDSSRKPRSCTANWHPTWEKTIPTRRSAIKFLEIATNMAVQYQNKNSLTRSFLTELPCFQGALQKNARSLTGQMYWFRSPPPKGREETIFELQPKPRKLPFVIPKLGNETLDNLTIHDKKTFSEIFFFRSNLLRMARQLKVGFGKATHSCCLFRCSNFAKCTEGISHGLNVGRTLSSAFVKLRRWPKFGTLILARLGYNTGHHIPLL